METLVPALTTVGAIGPIGFQEILIILAILLLLFGGRKIPELARGLGEGIRNFRSALKGGSNDGDEGDQSSGSSDGSNP